MLIQNVTKTSHPKSNDVNGWTTILDEAADLQKSLRRHLHYTFGKNWKTASNADIYKALAATVREKMIDRMIETDARFDVVDAKRVNYLSMEFLMGRALGNNLINLGMLDICRDMLGMMDFNLEDLSAVEPDAALGNGGLGRLAACFLDSLATLDMPATGYGINYEFGLFRQTFENGEQREHPDNWQRDSSPWLIERADEACLIPVYGKIDHAADRTGDYNPMWTDWRIIVGVPHDLPIAGYGGKTVNRLRLFTARSSEEFDIGIFNRGDYLRAVSQKIETEKISKVLYPADSFAAGKELRLVQEYFFTACALRDITRKFEEKHDDYAEFPKRAAIQLNDTHPAIAVAELMRLLVDEKSLEWETAREITEKTLAYTNHTLMPEALEKWSVALFEKVLPRHLQIIREINRRFLEKVAAVFPTDKAKTKRVSIIKNKQIEMGNLAIVGSHSVNGVSALHSELVKKTLVPDFYEIFPEKFNNKTNGVTPRRWLLKANPRLADLITEKIGDDWITNLEHLRELENFAGDSEFQRRFYEIKQANKLKLAGVIYKTNGIKVDVESMFDVQAKRIHEYKRQLLKALHIVDEYLCLIEDDVAPPAPRTFIFAGKAAPEYAAAKLIIKFINHVAAKINNDRRCDGRFKVAFIPDYRVSLAEKIIPAADLSEQISTAGMEASGTGNMKFALNGALTIGTLDGANVEILEEVGAENIFIFGLKTDEILEYKQRGDYLPEEIYKPNWRIRRVLKMIGSNEFCPNEPGAFKSLVEFLLAPNEAYFHLADFQSYLDAQKRAVNEYADQANWTRKAILNVAGSGKFSSDRTIRQYASDIWNVKSIG